MEALVGIVAELLVHCAAGIVAVVVDVVAGLVGLIAQLFGWSPPSFKRIALVVSALAFSLLVLCLSAVAVLSAFFFEPTSRWIADRVGASTGYEIAFEGASGNLLTGRMSLDRVEIRRTGLAADSFALDLEKVILDVDLVGSLIGASKVERLRIDGVRGVVTADGGGRAGGGPPLNLVKAAGRLNFVVRDLQIADVDIHLGRPDGPPVRYVFTRLAVAPFRGYLALFDLLFRSNISGEIDGHRIDIATSGSAAGRKTQWKFDALPVDLVRHYVGVAPATWLQAGVLEIEVEDRWRRDDEETTFDMDWRLRFLEPRVSAPAGASLIERAAVNAMSKHMNGREDVLIAFTMRYAEGDFASTASTDASALWRAILKAMILALEEMSKAKDQPTPNSRK